MILLFVLLILSLVGCSLLYIRYQLTKSWQEKQQHTQREQLSSIINTLREQEALLTMTLPVLTHIYAKSGDLSLTSLQQKQASEIAPVIKQLINQLEQVNYAT